jgi:hypothetical protein
VITYPGDYAVPGSMQPGAIVPGMPLSASGTVTSMYVYTGSAELIFPDFLGSTDGVQWGTLAAVPGGTYFILPVDARPGYPAVPGTPWNFTVVSE